jgi:hypothetical protein
MLNNGNYCTKRHVLCRKYLINKKQSQLTFFSTPMIRIRIRFENVEPHPVAMELAKKLIFFTLLNNFNISKILLYPPMYV